MIIKFSDFGTHLGTRFHGEQARNIIVNAIKNNDKVEFDFTGVELISNSFADESLAKLLLEFSFDSIKQKTTFTNTIPFVKAIIANAFKSRLVQVAKA